MAKTTNKKEPIMENTIDQVRSDYKNIAREKSGRIATIVSYHVHSGKHRYGVNFLSTDEIAAGQYHANGSQFTVIEKL